MMDSKVVTLNCNGLKGNFVYVKDLANKFDCIFLTETWILRSEQHLLSDFEQKFTIIPVYANKHNTGRPFGGTVLLLNRKMFTSVDIIILENHITIVKTMLKNISLIITGVYLPSTGSENYIDNYKVQLATIQGIHTQFSSSSESIILGDFQCCPDIPDSTRASQTNTISPILTEFITENNYTPVDITIGSGPTYTYHHHSMSNSSYIDHILVSPDFLHNVSSSSVIPPESTNTSDHLPVTASITLLGSTSFTNDPNPMPPQSNFTRRVPNYMWKNELFIDKYRTKISNHLSSSPYINTSIDEQIAKLQESLKELAYDSFNEIEQNHHRIEPKAWWNSNLTESRKQLQLMFNIWKSHNFPRDENSISYNRYKFARKQFRQLVRNAKNQSTVDYYIKIDKLDKVRPKTYWKNIKVHRSSSQKLFTINGKSSKTDINTEFSRHFNAILNTPGIDSIDNDASNSRLAGLFDNLPSQDKDFYITQSEVQKAIKNLNKEKSPDPFHILSEHYIHAISDEFLDYLTQLINRIFTEKHIPTLLGKSIIIPLVKSYNKTLKDPNNYRGISIMPILAKLIENIILNKCPVLKASHSSQFGFTNQSSTIHAELLLQDTIRFYNRNNSPLYICSLDVSKAFDSCNWSLLFEKLLAKKSIPTPIIRYLIATYLSSESNVVYGGIKSDSFKLSQGVKQGSIISPYLFNLYTEDLLSELANQRYGAFLPNGTVTSVIAFADDLILISSTLSGLQSLMDICVRYGYKHNLKFNHNKTQYLISGKSPLTDVTVQLDGKTIHPQDKLKHLGFLWGKSSSSFQLSHHIEYRISEMWSVVSSLVAGGVRFLHPSQIVNVFNTLVTPKLLYGLELVKLNNHNRDQIDRQARCALKSLLGVSKFSKNHLHIVYKIPNASSHLLNRKLNLVNQILMNSNTRDYALSVLSLTKHDRSFSIIDEIYDICLVNNVNFYDCMFNKKAQRISVTFPPLSEEQLEMRNCILEWYDVVCRMRFVELLESAIKR